MADADHVLTTALRGPPVRNETNRGTAPVKWLEVHDPYFERVSRRGDGQRGRFQLLRGALHGPADFIQSLRREHVHRHRTGRWPRCPAAHGRVDACATLTVDAMPIDHHARVAIGRTNPNAGE